MPYHEKESLSAIKELLQTVHRLRAPGGCPWDREQTHATLRPYLIEETYETIEVLDQIKTPSDLKNPSLKKAFIEEWGDVFLQILLNAEVASENDPEITIEAIAKSLNEKLIRRHPHVFGEVEVKGSGDVVTNWEQIKKSEKQNASGTSAASEPLPLLLSSVTRGLPPLSKAMKIIAKVTKVGFQWPDLKGPVEKLEEEVRELKHELDKGDPKENLPKIESELGDVLFNICNIAHFLKLDPEAALRSTIKKFESRFNHVETGLRLKGTTLEQSNLKEMDALWDEAKAKENP